MQPDPADEPEAEGYDLVVPFIACLSQGGPYDDDSFVAGFQAGRVDQALAAGAAVGATEVAITVLTPLVKQLDLIAMNRGFPIVVADVAAEVPEWSHVVFRTVPPSDSTT
jgi:hypothetical protein